MANLLNVIPQASNKTSSFSVDQNPAKMQGNELKELFQKQLSESLAVENLAVENSAILPVTDPNSLGAKDIDAEIAPVKENKKDLAEVALASGAVSAPKVVPLDLKQGFVDVQGKEIQLPNKLISAKNEIPDSMKELKKAELLIAGDSQNPVADANVAAVLNGQDLMTLSEEYEFDLDSVDLKNSSDKAVEPKAASSKLSTTDFLNLREISQNQMKPNSMVSPVLVEQAKLPPLPTAAGLVVGMKPTSKEKLVDDKDLSAAMNALAPSHGEKQIFGKIMDATVTQTAGQKPFLSQESVVNIGNQVNLLGQARQDGEVKIRLRPDHLGELQMSVRTQGQNVTVQIKAESNEAKKIIEDSLGALREHLSQQNLSLAKIDVVTQPNMLSSVDQAQMQFESNQNSNQSFMNQGDKNSSQDGSQGSGRDFYRDEPIVSAQPAKMMRSKVAESTRLDLIA